MIHFNLKIIANLCFVCLILVCLYSWKLLFSHKIVGVAAFLLQTSVILPRGCQSARLSDGLFTYFERDIRLIGLEPMTPRLSSACSNQLSYSRVDVEGKDRDSCRRLRLRGVDLRMLYPLTP